LGSQVRSGAPLTNLNSRSEFAAAPTAASVCASLQSSERVQCSSAVLMHTSGSVVSVGALVTDAEFTAAVTGLLCF
jgi:hypothetical protein